ncbi:MAG: hypothetical protein WC604_01090 [Candidatus Gracilibacteria bacterium]
MRKALDAAALTALACLGSCASLRDMIERPNERQWRKDIVGREAASAEIADVVRWEILDKCEIRGLDNEIGDTPPSHHDFRFRDGLWETVVFDHRIIGSPSGIQCAMDHVAESVASVASEKFQCEGRVFRDTSLDTWWNYGSYGLTPPAILEVECDLLKDPDNLL